MLKTAIPCLVQNNIQPQQLPILVLAGHNKSQFAEGVTCTHLHYVQGALQIPDHFNKRLHYSISKGSGFDQYKQAIAMYIHLRKCSRHIRVHSGYVHILNLDSIVWFHVVMIVLDRFITIVTGYSKFVLGLSK